MDYNKLPSNNPAISGLNNTKEFEAPGPARVKAEFHTTQIKKDSALKKLFVKGDLSIVKDYLIKDALPSFKAWLFTTGVRIAENFIFGQSNYMGAAGKGTLGYFNYVQPKIVNNPAKINIQTNNIRKYDFSDMLFENDMNSSGREKAAACLRRLDDFISEYNSVTVGQFIDLVGGTPVKTDWNYAWRDLSTAQIREVVGGCVLILPDPQPLN